ncbi:FAD-binding oxidoreductase [Aquimarina aquimarini]|uniref:FAD-binding oxidoreductase n=1 Tax=Aquimarina aquimarini TaxID=1191734 RepID=UPI000D55E87C|nr:FAD-binding oxidoreductase [Aquimarina aquimarini]
MNKFYQLKVLEVKKETQDCVSVSFDVPYELHETFNYKPGQYLTLKFNLNGKEIRRSYSLCSSPVIEKSLRISLKLVKNELVSNHINNTIKVGDFINVMPPDGRFFVDVKKENSKTYYLFSAGSGITPIFSILKTVLLTEECSYVYMIYGNRTENSILFKKELDKLIEKYGDRFILEYTLSHPNSNWNDLWKPSKEQIFRKGRIDTKLVKWFINEFPLYAKNAEYYICGPETMIENTKKTLKAIDVPNERIFFESFERTNSNDSP